MLPLGEDDGLGRTLSWSELRDLALAVPSDGRETPPASTMRGTAEEVGHMLAVYRDHGIDHLIVHLWPRRPEAVAELGRAAEVARA